MDLIERYLAEVKRHLPGRMRDDVCRELRSNIEDSADVRSDANGGRRDDVVTDILAEYGPPAEMARFYLPQRYVVGPRFYYNYRAAVKIMLVVLAGLFALGLATEIATEQTGIRDVLWLLAQSAGEFTGAAVTLLGIITVIFIVIERVAESEPAESADVEPWDPRTLPQIEDTTRINRVSLAVDICLYIGLFIFFNFFRQYAGIFNHTNGQWWFLPLSGPGFPQHLLWLNLFWVASLANAAGVLRAGRWTVWSRSIRTALAAFLVVILARMALDADLAGLPRGWPQDYPEIDGVQERFAELTAPVVGALVRIGIGIAAVVTTIGVLKNTVRIVRERV
jgi:hypothetical protein